MLIVVIEANFDKFVSCFREMIFIIITIDIQDAVLFVIARDDNISFSFFSSVQAIVHSAFQRGVIERLFAFFPRLMVFDGNVRDGQRI